MSDVNAVVRWDEPQIYDIWQLQIGHADQPASEHMPAEADGWCVMLSQANGAGDWWLKIGLTSIVGWDGLQCPATSGIVHSTPTGTTSLAVARTIASASVAALQHGHMTGITPPDLSYCSDEEAMGDDWYPGPGDHHGWCLCDECKTPAELRAEFVDMAVAQIPILSTCGREVSQHLGFGTAPLRFLDIEEEWENGMV